MAKNFSKLVEMYANLIINGKWSFDRLPKFVKADDVKECIRFKGRYDILGEEPPEIKVPAEESIPTVEGEIVNESSEQQP